MSAKFATIHNPKYMDPSDRESFFDIKKDLDTLRRHDKRERPAREKINDHCTDNLFFGFFHDGTRNNLGASLEKGNFTQSNVARLYSAFPGLSVPNVVKHSKAEWINDISSFSNYFRVYTPGVGSPFSQISDSGEGLDKKLGAAIAFLGQRRIIWTLAQAINNVHRYFLKSELISAAEILGICRQIDLNKYTLSEMAKKLNSQPVFAGEAIQQGLSPRDAFRPWLEKMHQAIHLHMPDPITCKPKRVDPGIVKQIYVSVFGYSRGAASARVFTNWLIALCTLDAQLLGKAGMTLGGFPVTFDFIGLFDTVASVGKANTFGIFDGHDAWSDAEVSMRIPNDIKCLHLVSGHEVRRSFPLDSISLKNSTPEIHAEIVYPGVHSDLGGGYAPREQGKGQDSTGKDMLSRLPLAHMYREARLAGVPLKLELADQWVKDDFMLAPATIDAFNKYINASKLKEGSLTDIMREQRKYYILWRLARRAENLRTTVSFVQADPPDKNDLDSANSEFEKEIEKFNQWKNQRAATGQSFTTQPPGFHNSSKDSEWQEVAIFWDKEKLPDAMASFFDNYVHDSRAWFKLTGTESDDVEAQLQEWVSTKNHFDAKTRIDGFEYDPLTPDQRKWATEYETTKKIPRMPNSGRELLNGAGYLRYRRIYAGGDSILITRNQGTPDKFNTAQSKTFKGDAAVPA